MAELCKDCGRDHTSESHEKAMADTSKVRYMVSKATWGLFLKEISKANKKVGRDEDEISSTGMRVLMSDFISYGLMGMVKNSKEPTEQHARLALQEIMDLCSVAVMTIFSKDKDEIK